MPFISTYGLGVTLQTITPSGSNIIEAATIDPVLDESNVFQTWVPTKGMTHPIYATTILTPQAKKSIRAIIPFKIVVEFNPDDDMPPYMRGDIRVEALVDGIPCGLRVFREVKLRGKGFRVEFSGFRVGRTEERPLVFHTLPKHLQKDHLFSRIKKEPGGEEAISEPGRISNPGAQWTQNAVLVGEPHYEPDGSDGCHYPEKPEGVPKHVSHIEVLVSVGKKFLTLEKYFMAGASQTTAFYHPPKPWTPLDPKEWRPPGKTSPAKLPRITGYSGTHTKSSGKRAMLHNVPDDCRVTSDSPLIVGTKTFAATEKPSTWKPIGLSPFPKKCQQAKEVEYSARIHLVRFWIFVVPNLTIGNESTIIPDRIHRHSHVVVIRLPPEKLLHMARVIPDFEKLSEANIIERDGLENSESESYGTSYDDFPEITELRDSTFQSINSEESLTSTPQTQSSSRVDDHLKDAAVASYYCTSVAPITSASTQVLRKRKNAEFEDREYEGFPLKPEACLDTSDGPITVKKVRQGGTACFPDSTDNDSDPEGVEISTSLLPFDDEFEAIELPPINDIRDFSKGTPSSD